MLRGKFGQLGTNLGDGHVTMDAFQQAAFRDHIRSGERIMFLAATGRLKHKRTRNTIAAEPTPRSSCSSNKAESSAVVAAPAAADRFRVGTAPIATPAHRHERESTETNGNTTRGAFSSSYRRETPGSRAGCDSHRRRDKPGRLAGGSSAFEDSGAPCASPPRSPIQMPSPLASAKVPGPYLHCFEAERNKSMLTADENPPPGASGRRGGPGMESSPAMSTASPRTQQTCDGRRARSADPARRQSHQLGLRTSLHRSRSNVSATAVHGENKPGRRDGPSKSARLKQAVSMSKGVVGNVPLHVGPVTTGVDGPEAAKNAGVSSAHDDVSLRLLVNRPRPASAGAVSLGRSFVDTRRRANPPGTVARGFGVKGGDRGFCQSHKSRIHDTPTARLSLGGGQSPSTEEGSFVASVVESARPLLVRYNARQQDGSSKAERLISRAERKKFQRPRSAGTSPFEAATRLTSGGDVDRRSNISRSAAVQAAGLTSAAAACAATAEKLLRRTILGKATGNSGARQVSAPPNTTAAAMRVNAQTRERNGKGNGGVGRPGSPSLVRAADGQDDGVVGWKGRSRSKGVCCVGGGNGGDGGGDSSKIRRRALVQREPTRCDAAAAASVWDVTRTKNECHRSTPKHTLTSDHGDNAVTAGADSSNGSGKVPRTADEQRGTERGRSPCRARLSNFADPGSVYGGGSNLSSRCSTSNCEGVCLSTARTSNATSCSSRSASTRKCLNSRRIRSKSGVEGTEVAERRMRLLAELKTLRRRMKRAEGLLREVDSSLLSRPARRPHTAAHRTLRKSPEQCVERRASTAATAGNTSAKSSAGYGAFNLGERRICPVVVTHQANDFLDES